MVFIFSSDFVVIYSLLFLYNGSKADKNVYFFSFLCKCAGVRESHWERIWPILWKTELKWQGDLICSKNVNTSDIFLF